MNIERYSLLDQLANAVKEWEASRYYNVKSQREARQKVCQVFKCLCEYDSLNKNTSECDLTTIRQSFIAEGMERWLTRLDKENASLRKDVDDLIGKVYSSTIVSTEVHAKWREKYDIVPTSNGWEIWRFGTAKVIAIIPYTRSLYDHNGLKDPQKDTRQIAEYLAIVLFNRETIEKQSRNKCTLLNCVP